MAKLYSVHPETPQTRNIDEIVSALRAGAIMLYPTDTVYAIGCDLNVKSAIERVRQIKSLSNDKPLTFLCPSLSNIAHYAIVSDTAYKIMRRLIPGTFTFILPATKLVPKLVQNPKRKTTGIRVPDHRICMALLETLGNPIISTSAHLIQDEDINPVPIPTMEKANLFDHLENMVDIIIDHDIDPGYQVSTILDLTSETPEIIRKGLGWEMAQNLY